MHRASAVECRGLLGKQFSKYCFAMLNRPFQTPSTADWLICCMAWPNQKAGPTTVPARQPVMLAPGHKGRCQPHLSWLSTINSTRSRALIGPPRAFLHLRGWASCTSVGPSQLNDAALVLPRCGSHAGRAWFLSLPHPRTTLCPYLASIRLPTTSFTGLDGCCQVPQPLYIENRR